MQAVNHKDNDPQEAMLESPEAAASSTTTAAGEPPARAVSSLEGLLVSDSEAARSNNNASIQENSTSNDNNNNHVLSDEEEEQDDESEYEYEDDDDAAAFGGFLAVQGDTTHYATAATTSSSEPARIDDEEEQQEPKKPKWKEPSKQAVNMSLRAEKETSGGKRRLAQDLYKIMMSDTSEAGFSLEPASEDKMDKWTIRLFGFDEDSNLAKDMLVLGVDHVELEFTFPDDYPFEPPFVRVVRPRFKRQTGFVMHGALCMELLTKDGWNPINDIESVIVSIRSLMVVGDGRLQAAVEMPEKKRQELLQAHAKNNDGTAAAAAAKRDLSPCSSKKMDGKKPAKISKPAAASGGGHYTAQEAASAYAHITDYHKKKGWDNSGWWAKKG